MPRPLQVVLGIALVLLGILVPMLIAREQLKETKNFRIVKWGVLYRSGQMNLDGLKRILHDYRIKTVISLRDGTTASDLAEEAYCQKQEVQFFRIPPRPWEGPGDRAPVDQGVKTFRNLLADPSNYPVLVHCFAGIHRTGAYCAIYRMEFQGWSNERAIQEVKAAGYDNLDSEKDILGYLVNYQPVLFGDQVTR
jgi:tyrosine-protein phosphatase SIW14